jgi:hypothetical protein
MRIVGRVKHHQAPKIFLESSKNPLGQTTPIDYDGAVMD